MEMNKQNDEIEIDLRQILGLLWSKALIIIMVGIILGLIALIGSKLFISPVYQSSTKLYILNRQNATGTTTLSDIQTSTQLTKDYKILVTSRTVTEQVISELGLDMTAAQLAGSITVNTPTDTRVLEIVVQNHDQYKAKEIADKVAQISADSICKIMDTEKVNVIEAGDFPSAPVSPNVKKNALIAAILGMLLSSAVIIVKFLMNDTIRSSEDIEKYLGISTLALIPLSEELNDGEGRKKKKKRSSSSVNHARKQVEK